MTDMCNNYTKQMLMNEMSELPQEDRRILIEHNADIMFTFKSSVHFGEEGKGKKKVKQNYT